VTKENNGMSIEDFIQSSDEPTLIKASAEINSLLKMGLKEGDRVVLLSSDTDEGESAACNIAGAKKRLKNFCIH
jgi:hypothetical protein